MEKIARGIINFVSRPNYRFKILLIAVVLALPIVIVVYLDYAQSRDSQFLNESGISFAALSLKEQVDHLVDVGLVFSRRLIFRQVVEEKRWQDALTYTTNPIFDSTIEPYIDRILLTDTSGTLMAAAPPNKGIEGRDFSYRDWFEGISKDWQPYVSAVYQRTSPPQYKVIGISFPIVSPLVKDAMIGILVFQVKISHFSDWLNKINAGSQEIIYIIDQKGQLIGQSGNGTPSATGIADSPIVREVLAGKSGEIVYVDPSSHNEKIAAYEPIQPYGWGIIMEKPMGTSIFVGNSKNTLLTYGLLILYFYLIVSAAAQVVRILKREGCKIQPPQL